MSNTNPTLGDIYARLMTLAESIGAGVTAEQIESIARAIAKVEAELPSNKPLKPEAIEALSYIITTATEGGEYTRDDFRIWRNYKHGDDEHGRFNAEVTVIPNDDVDGIPHTPIRMTPQELGRRLLLAVERNEIQDSGHPKVREHHRLMIARLAQGDQDIAGECDVVDAGALMQIAVYGEVVYG
jgi:hypothetical protein